MTISAFTKTDSVSSMSQFGATYSAVFLGISSSKFTGALLMCPFSETLETYSDSMRLDSPSLLIIPSERLVYSELSAGPFS